MMLLMTVPPDERVRVKGRGICEEPSLSNKKHHSVRRGGFMRAHIRECARAHNLARYGDGSLRALTGGTWCMVYLLLDDR